MKSIKLFIGKARIFKIDSHAYFDWVIDFYYSEEKEKQQFVFAKNYQIENIWLEELIKRHLIWEIEKKDSSDKKFFFDSEYRKMQKLKEHISHYRQGKKARPRDDLFLQLNIKLFTQEYVLFDFMFWGYKYVLRDIYMPMELYNEFVYRARPIVKFMKDYKIFIAHASEDKDTAKKIAEDISRQGYQVWFDEWEIKVGDSIVDKINQGIKNTAYMIVLLSSNSVNKPWVKRELSAAFMQELERERVFILPALLEKCEIPPLISDKRYANFTRSYDTGLSELIKAL